MTSILDKETPTEEDEKREKKRKKMLLKKELTKMLLDENYNFTPNPKYEYYEPSSDKPIDENDLTFEKLGAYHVDNYHVCDKPYNQLEKIEQIIGKDRAEEIIKLNKSEYYKVLTHFMILSLVKSSWVHFLANSPTKTPKPSLTNNPSPRILKKSKKLHDAIIRCFYSRLIQGMSEQEKERYQILLSKGSLLSGFDGLLFKLDTAIQDLFSFEKSILDGDDESLLPDANLDEAILKTFYHLYSILDRIELESYSTDTLRATLIKYASLNRAINDIDAIINIQNEIIQDLPDIGDLIHIESESEILPAISSIFNEQIMNLPDDLIECSKLVCSRYIVASAPPKEIDEFNERHMMPDNIAVSAALLYHDYLQGKELNLNISGETNPYINVYKTISDLAKKIEPSDVLVPGILWKYGFPEELFKYLTTRYSISVFGLSYIDPIQIGAEAHLRVRKDKLEFQREVYKFLKVISVKDAYLFIDAFCQYVVNTIKTARDPLNS